MKIGFKKALLLAGWMCVFGADGYAESPVLRQLLNDADGSNPLLLVEKDRVDIADSRVGQVTSLNDPQLDVSFSSYPVDELKSNITPMTGNDIRLSQMFPFPGKLDARGKAAMQSSRWFHFVYEDARLQVKQQIKDAWYRLLFLRQAIELTTRNLQLLDDFIRLTETRYQVGQGLQQNVLKANLQRSKQMDKLLVLQQQQQATLAELNSLAGRPTDQLLQVDESLTETALRLNVTALQQQAIAARPMFAGYEALIEQYHAQRDLATLDYRPDFTLWAGYRWRDDALDDGGTDFVSAGISFNLPVRREKRSAAVAEADSSLRAAYHRRDDFRNGVMLTIHRALTSFEQAGQQAELYREGIIPQANQTFQATLSAYQVNKVDFLDLLDSLMTLYRYEIDYLQALSDQQRSLARIEAASGLDVVELAASYSR